MSISPPLVRRIVEAGDRAGYLKGHPMRVMVIVKATHKSEGQVLPVDESLLKEMGAFNEELVKAGIMLSGDGLRPSREGKRVRFSGTNRTVIDGPFAETKELVAGYWLWRVKSMEEAVAWVKRCPNPMPGSSESEIEIRPLYETEDFAAVDPSGEIRKQEHELRKTLEARQR
jgi:hypothetical protein